MRGAANWQVVFDPLIAWPVLGAVGVLFAVLVAFAAWRGLAGWTARGLAAAILLLALAGPSMQVEERNALTDILLVVVDETASQSLGERRSQSAAALAALEAQVAARDGLELVVVRLQDAPDDGGSRLEAAIGAALGDVARDRVAGIVAISDGVIDDAGLLAGAPALPAPLHLLLSGAARDWDRRLVVTSAPAFAILGEEQVIGLRVEDSRLGTGEAGRAWVSISIDGGAESRHEVPVGVDLELPLRLTHGGQNVVRIVLDAADGELTERNNAAVVQINGVRDRLRVLLVTGTPHPGTRTWRNLLKADASVDLVHFTILRPPEKQDGVPVSELSLIAFPTQELFIDKIDEFDLIIFDRYELRGILPAAYLASVRAYVEQGGAVLVAAGPAFASAGSLARSPLGPILPGLPTSQVSEGAFRPTVTALGRRHPVTQGLEATAGAGAGEGGWGRWLRQVGVVASAGNVVMEGAGGAPLLILDRVGKGRVALLASDHAWLWSRGFEGGGPQLELLRRLAHWMMGEPELEEEALWADVRGGNLQIIRQTLGEKVPEVEVTLPDGTVQLVELQESVPGRFEASFAGRAMGLYRLREGALEAVVALGPSAPREFARPLATPELLAPLVKATGGGIRRLEDGMPDLRFVRAGRVAAGRGWIGLNAREAYVTTSVRLTPLLPGWLALLFGAGLMVWGWLREGRR